jgi:hypothetical protein
MTGTDEEVPWEAHEIAACDNFGLRCRELQESCPYSIDELGSPVLTRIMTHLATDLWDQSFSQAEIISAFEAAIRDLPRYAAGEERRGDPPKGPKT